MPARTSFAAVALSLASAFVPVATCAASRVDCAPLLEDAEESFNEGRFDDARNYLNACLGNRPPKAFRVLSLALLAKVELAEDDLAVAESAVREILRLEPDYEADPRDPPRFRGLVEEAGGSRQEVKVSSVSKSAESLREAPATVEVLDSHEIRRRGYVDLEALLHDLPGFDISRGNGTAYSNIYQRGFRSNATDRTLLLVDGVEQNDLFSNIAWISRQYPLSNVDRVEVIYGPASTMYGPNAYTGVINVITKTPEQLLGESRSKALSKFENLSVHAELGAGSFSTSWVDTTVAGKTAGGGLSFTLTGRLFRSDEPDLSGFPTWDYDPNGFFRDDEYMRFGAENNPELLAQCLATQLCEADSDGDRLILTPKGAGRARQLDAMALTTPVGGEEVGFSDLTDDGYLSGKIHMQNVEIGFHTWQRREGSTPWYRETARPGADNGFTFIPEETAFHIRYGREIVPDLTLTFFSQFKRHETDPDTSTFSLRAYGNGNLRLEDLFDGQAAYYRQTRLLRSSNQLRNELTFVYEPSSKFNLVAGGELRNGSIQIDNDRVSADGPGEIPDTPSTIGGEDADVRDLGFFAQASYRPREDLKLVLGGRWDNNKIDIAEGFGTVFNPRLAVVYTPGDFAFKAIWAEAFKDASNFNRFATIRGTRELDNPDLEPESVSNFELSASWQVEGRQIEVAAYEATYEDVISVLQVPFCSSPDGPRTCEEGEEPVGRTGQFNNIGEFRVRGLQASGRFRFGRFDVFANYTYTDPVNTNALGGDFELRVGDIAEHRANLGFFTELWKSLELDARLNFVGERKAGAGTTVDPRGPRREFGSYAVVHAAATWKDVVKGIDLQIVANNLFDKDHAHPGIRSAGDGTFAVRLPQPGTSAYFRARVRY